VNPQEYEQVLSQLVRAIYELAEGIAPEQVRYGSTNLWKGASSYQHQIDVSVLGPGNVLLVECKCWKEKVPVEKVLAFFGRIHDIGPAFQGQIHPVIVTTKGFQPGAEMVARYYGIDLKIVRSATEFAIAYKNHTMFGVHDVAHISTYEAATVRRLCATCGTDLVPEDDKKTFKCPRCNV
jgi:hypothetical protein